MEVGIAYAATICLITSVAAAVAIGLGTCKAVEAVARQPEASGKIMGVAVLGLALAEATAIYGLLVAILLVGKI